MQANNILVPTPLAKSFLVDTLPGQCTAYVYQTVVWQVNTALYKEICVSLPQRVAFMYSV